jgi:hypothetical protein
MVFGFFYVFIATDGAFPFFKASGNTTLMIFLLQKLATIGADRVVVNHSGVPLGGRVGVGQRSVCQSICRQEGQQCSANQQDKHSFHGYTPHFFFFVTIAAIAVQTDFLDGESVV